MIMEEIWGKSLAFVVIDAQKKFYLERSDWNERLVVAVDGINAFADEFRKAGKPVIFVRFNGPTCRPYEGDDGDDLFEGIRFEDGDIYVDKDHIDSFHDTDLEEIVRSHGCDTVVLAGTVAQFCVISTYYSAFEHNLKTYLAHDLCLGTDAKAEESVEYICKVLTLDRIKRFFSEGE